MFDQNYKFGKIGESLIAKYFRNIGYTVLPIYEKEISEGKGPTLFFPDREVIGSDMMVFKEKTIFWVEVKHKTAFSWHRITSKWVTGIDIKYYEDYKEIMKRTAWPVWLIFYQEGGHAKDSPETSPAGIFGNDLNFLKDNENHFWPPNWKELPKDSKRGMVYWAIDKLQLIVTKEELQNNQLADSNV